MSENQTLMGGTRGEKAFFVVIMIALAGCSHGFLRTDHPEQENNQAKTTMREEFRSKKIYQILEEKGTYYVVRLKTTEVVPEKETPNGESPGAAIYAPGDSRETQAQSQVQFATPEKKAELKIEIPKATLLGVASSQQAKATADLMVDSRNACAEDAE